MQAVSDPSSATYGKWLTNKQFNATYAPAASDVKAVQGWLPHAGLHRRRDPPERHVRRGVRHHGAGRQDVQHPAGEVLVPGQDGAGEHDQPLAPERHVGSDRRLGQRRRRPRPGHGAQEAGRHEPGPGPGFRTGVQPCSAYYGQKTATDKPAVNGKKQPYVVCGYEPQQLQGAYGVSSQLKKGIDGKGVTVGDHRRVRVADDPAGRPDVQQGHGQPLFRKNQFSQITPSSERLLQRRPL